jgi:hypothetical protein
VLSELLSYLDTFADFAGGPLLVALFYWFRFNSLRGTRSYTTGARYYLGLITFTMPFVLIYFLLVPFSSLEAVWVLIALWLIPVLPKAWRRFCHRIVQIPTYAHSMQEAIAVAPFEVPPKDLPAIHRQITRLGYRLDDFQAVQSAPIQSRFIKITAIMHHLEEWNRKNETFMQRNSEHFSDLRHSYDLLSFKAIRALRNTSATYGAIMDDTKVQPDDWKALDSLAAHDEPANKLQSAAQNAAGCMLEDLRKDMDLLLSNLFLFAARASLANEWNFAGCKRRLGTIGFKIAERAPGIAPTIIRAGTVTLIWTLIWIILLSGQGLEAAPVDRARMFVFPLLNIVINILVVYYCKRNFAFANEGSIGRYPIEFILTIGFFTAILIFPLRALFDYYQYHGDGQFMHAFVRGLPASIFPWGVGATTALLVQDSIWDAFKSERVKRIMDGVTFGACMVLLILLLLAIHWIAPIPQMHNVDKVSPLVMIGSSFGFGFVLGYFLMARVRSASSLRVSGAQRTPSGALMRA